MCHCAKYLAAFGVILLVLAAGCIDYGGAKKYPKAITLVISSDTNSNYTPCGCRGGKWGGLPRRGTMFKEIEQSASWPVFFVDTGNVVQGSTGEQYALKDKYIFQAYGLLGYDIVNVGMSDIRLGQAELARAGEENNIPWTSSNLFAQGALPRIEEQSGALNPTDIAGDSAGTGNPGSGGQAEAEENWPPVPQDVTPVFAANRVVEPDPVNLPGFRVGFVGALVEDPLLLNAVTDFSFEHYIPAIKAQVDAMRAEHVSLVVLVCNTDTFENIDTARAFTGVDIVIGGNNSPQPSPNAGLNPDNPGYDAANATGQPNASTAPNPDTPASAQGAVVLEPLTELPLIFPKARQQGKLLTRVDIYLDSKGAIVDYFINQSLQVNDSFEDDPRLAEVSSAYDTQVLAGELSRRASARNAGSLACESCHPGFGAVWANHGHFKSYRTIVDENKLDDRSCTGCHAVGYLELGRLPTYDLIPENLRNVGCEGCHAGGQSHISLVTNRASLSPGDHSMDSYVDQMSNPIEQSTCLECHQGRWGEGFDFNAAMEAARQICGSVASNSLTLDEIRDQRNPGGPAE
jgi:2',3'-cyclic-nucleotide 2'-phosphodiesterase (5'-nucleotidase family)